MATPEGFNVRVVDGLRAHFKQPAGPSRPGTEWAISLTSSAGERQIFVRTYADDFGQLSQEQEAQLALEYVGHLIQTGWSPEQYRGEPGELIVPNRSGATQIATPLPQRDNQPLQRTGAAAKRSWFQKLFGGDPGS
jgi:hypothetical protein